MSISIAGMGWVTPLGAELGAVWEQIARGTAPVLKTIANPETGREHLCAPVPPSLTEALNRNPRLRRSSPISYFAVAAGLAALADAGLSMTPELAARTAVVFAIGNGGVICTMLRTASSFWVVTSVHSWTRHGPFLSVLPGARLPATIRRRPGSRPSAAIASGSWSP